jgi:hypothetical protein
MYAEPRWSGFRAIVVAALAGTLGLVVVGAAPPTARSDDAPLCPKDGAYTMTLRALTGPADTELRIGVAAAPGCGAVTTVRHVQIKIHELSGNHVAVKNLNDVAVTDGAALVTLDRIDRGRRIEVQSQVKTGTQAETLVLDGNATAMLRPDLTVTSVQAPLQTLTTRAIDVLAEVGEVKGDTGATAHVTLAGTIGPVAAPVDVTVPAGGHVSVTFPGVVLSMPAATELRVIVSDTAPVEYDIANQSRATKVEVTKHELVSSRLLVPSLGGYGYQFNGHLYAPITNPPPATLLDLESKVKALEPQLVRIFYNDNWEANADKSHPEWAQNLESFKDVVELANDSGASIVIDYQSVTYARTNPTLWMGRFADVLQDLVQTRGLTNVRWAVIGNEPNSTSLPLTTYEALYRALDAQLVTRGLRTQIGLVGGDLVQLTEGTASGHRAWFDYMATHMNDVIDAWSEHIYWNYWDHFRMEQRLKDVSYLVHTELPESARKPTFILEYGVRGMNACGTETTVTAAYYNDPPACTELRRMSLAGFQKVWFTVTSAQLGFDGASNWDLFWSIYDRGKNQQSYWTIGPPEENWALYPSYYAAQLLDQTTARGWQVLAVDPVMRDDEATRYDDPYPDELEQELTAYHGPDGQLTLVGLDTRGGELIAPTGESSAYSVGGLPPFTTFTLALWNGTGDGTNSVVDTITTTGAGVARFDVPLQAAFVLTTVPVS